MSAAPCSEKRVLGNRASSWTSFTKRVRCLLLCSRRDSQKEIAASLLLPTKSEAEAGTARAMGEEREAPEKFAKARRARSSNASARSARSSRSVRSAILSVFASQQNANATMSKPAPFATPATPALLARRAPPTTSAHCSPKPQRPMKPARAVDHSIKLAERFCYTCPE